MSQINLVVRTADQTRKAELDVDSENLAKDIIDSAVLKWSLPTDSDYTLVNVTKGKNLIPNSTLAINGLENGDIVEIQPVLVAG